MYMKNLIKYCVCAVVIGFSMACFAACTKEEIAALEEPAMTVAEETDDMTPLTDTEEIPLDEVEGPIEVEDSMNMEHQITLEEFQAMVEAMMAESENQKETAAESFFDREKAEEAFQKANEVRLSHGIGALTWDEDLYSLACNRAQEIVTKFSHERPDGSYVGSVLLEQMGASGCGENIASNYQSTANLINGWMASEGHRENLLNSSFYGGAMGCYCHDGNYYWVHLFWQ